MNYKKYLFYITAILLLCQPLPGSEAETLSLRSDSFLPGGSIPAKYTHDGKDINPPLQWHGVSRSAKSIVLIMDDPDAPDPKAPKMTWVHWLLYNIPPATKKLPEDAERSGLPQGAREGLNSWKQIRYGGPNPPIGRHRYYFKLYTLDRRLSFPKTPNKDQLLKAMQGHILQRAELIGTYQKR